MNSKLQNFTAEDARKLAENAVRDLSVEEILEETLSTVELSAKEGNKSAGVPIFSTETNKKNREPVMVELRKRGFHVQAIDQAPNHPFMLIVSY